MREARRAQQQGNHAQKEPRPVKHHSVIGALLTIILTFSLFIAVGSGVLRQTAFNPDFVANEITKTNAAKTLTKKVNTEAVNYATQYHIPSSAVSNLVTKTAVQSDLTQTIKNIYANKADPVSTTHIIAHVKQNLTTAIEKNVPLLAGSTTIVDLITTQLTSSYQQMLQVPQVTQAESQLASYNQIIQAVFWIALVVSIVGLILLLISDHHLFLTLRHIGWAALISGGLLFLLRIGMNTLGIVDYLAIAAKEFSEVATQLGNTIINSFTLPSIVLMLIGIVSLIVGHLKRVR
ncbi:hypothetical protein [Loigolactobacillus iwatensis]|uniref:hypothetical protein n=1 Tax=Loigolactobacillus iwatensis TaxID=1267156 RepID=UPI000F7E8716|nr:hypothetical protein [Loigolactobacillus iwatensis]